MSDIRRVAGIQTDVTFANADANTDRMIQWLRSPSVAECDLVVFPECMLTGYCYDSAEEAMPIAQTLPGPASEAIGKICQVNDQYVAFGLLERSLTGELYNSCVLIGPTGIVGVYRKVHLPYLGIDRFVTQGREPFRTWDADGMRVGMHICYDASFPECSRSLALEGADLIILPTNWPPGADTFAKYLPNARALENNVFFLAVNRVGEERGFRFIGQSRMCDTNGNSLAEGGDSGEVAIITDIDIDRARSKRLVRVPGKHVIDRLADRRPEYYNKLVEPHQLVRRIED